MKVILWHSILNGSARCACTVDLTRQSFACVELMIASMDYRVWYLLLFSEGGVYVLWTATNHRSMSLSNPKVQQAKQDEVATPSGIITNAMQRRQGSILMLRHMVGLW